MYSYIFQILVKLTKSEVYIADSFIIVQAQYAGKKYVVGLLMKHRRIFFLNFIQVTRNAKRLFKENRNNTLF